MITWLANLIAPLNHMLFQLGNDAVTWAELLGFVTGGACVWLTLRRHIANFPVGIANSAFFLVLFLSARLWADGWLQVVYIALGFLGWWQWRHGGEDRQALPIGRASMPTLLACSAFVVVATVGLTIVLRAVHDVAPFWDAITTALSLAAQWLLNAKKLQTWWFWIAADCIYIPLYAVKRLDLTAIVYLLFLAMCVGGLRGWQRAHAASLIEPSPAPEHVR